MRPYETSAHPFAAFDPAGDRDAQLAKLFDTAAIWRLKTTFVSSCDPYDEKLFASLFTEDGIYTSDEYGTYNGREEIEAFIAKTKLELVWTHHILTNGDVEVDSEAGTATGRWYLHALENVKLEDGSIEGWEVFAEYNDVYKKIDGRWWIAQVAPIGHSAKRVNDGWLSDDH